MITEEKLNSALKKVKQYENRRHLKENQIKDSKAKMDLRRKVLIGEMFLNHFPVSMKFIPGKTCEEDERIFESLDNFMEALSQCQQCFQAMEDALFKSESR